MKQLAIMVCVALFAAGCMRENRETVVPEGKVAVEIDVSPLGGYELVTRADEGKGPMTGWYNTEVYMAYAQALGSTFPGFSEAKRGIVVSNKTSFQPQLFYPALQTVWLRGFHPRECVTNLGTDMEIDASGEVHYTITGHEDIMISNTLSGSEQNSFNDQNAKLHYEHLLTQLSFKMVCEIGFPSSYKVKYIRIKGVRINAVLDLNVEPDMTNPDNPALLVFGAETGDLIAYENTSGLALPENNPTELGYVMFRPNENFDIEVEFTNGDKVLVTEIVRKSDGLDISDGNTVRGKHYLVELTFKTVGMLPSVTALWNPEDVGGSIGWW